jgi:hypothetical protein
MVIKRLRLGPKADLSGKVKTLQKKQSRKNYLLKEVTKIINGDSNNLEQTIEPYLERVK